VSDFVLNLVRRGAGLVPAVALRPPFVPSFAPNLGTAHTTEPEPATAEVPTHGEPAPAVVSVPPPRLATPAETPHQPSPVATPIFFTAASGRHCGPSVAGVSACRACYATAGAGGVFDSSGAADPNPSPHPDAGISACTSASDRTHSPGVWRYPEVKSPSRLAGDTGGTVTTC